MFTGIIEEVGVIADISNKGKSAKVTITCDKVLNGTQIGDSIAVSGACLTVVEMGKNSISADISYETLERTSLRQIKPGIKVNLERALQLSSRLGGHLVAGHVDEVGIIKSIKSVDGSYVLKVKYPKSIDRYIVQKGSVTIDGISLTVASVNSCELEVAVIPHTFEITNLINKKAGDDVNVEIDMLARYIEKLVDTEDKDKRLKSLIENM